MTCESSDDPYDIQCDNNLDEAHFRFMSDELEVLKITSTVRNNIIRVEQHRTADYLLRALKAILSEQQYMGLLHSTTSNYIWEAVKDQAVQRGYLD